LSELKSILSSHATPVIVVGVGRSGTTPLRFALHAHPEILMASGHSPMVPFLGRAAYQYFGGPNHLYYQRYTALPYDDVLDRLRSLCLDCVWNDEELFTVTHSEQGARRDHSCIQRWGTRAYPDQQAAEGIATLFPRTLFIHIVRNGIEVVQSMAKYKAYRRLDFEKRCRIWSHRVMRDRFLASRQDCFSIRFENFLDKPDEVMAGVLSFLHLPHDDAPARFLNQTVIHPLDQGTVQTNARALHRNRPPAYSTWTEKDRASFRAICGKAMALLNYAIPF
jgi:hypothetical protein